MRPVNEDAISELIQGLPDDRLAWLSARVKRELAHRAEPIDATEVNAEVAKIIAIAHAERMAEAEAREAEGARFRIELRERLRDRDLRLPNHYRSGCRACTTAIISMDLSQMCPQGNQDLTGKWVKDHSYWKRNRNERVE